MTVIHVDFHSRSRDTYTAQMGYPESDFKAANEAKEKLNSPKPKRERSSPTRLHGLTFQPLKQRFKGANVEFNLETQEAYSYGWWRFVERIGPYLVKNTYSYSVTTSKHQGQIGNGRYGLLSDLGLKVDFDIECPKGLQNLGSAIDLYNDRISDLEAAISKRGSRKLKNAERLKEIDQLRIKIATVQMLQKIRESEQAKAAEA